MNKEKLIQLRDDYLKAKRECEMNAIANEGAAQAIQNLINDLEKEENKNNEKVN